MPWPKHVLSEDLGLLIEAHLLPCRRSSKDRRPRVNDRADLTGIVLVLRTGIPEKYRFPLNLSGVSR